MNKGVIQIRKRNLSCHNRSITNYDLKQIQNARAVWRGLTADAVNNQRYSIILEFNQNELGTDDSTTGYESSDREIDRFHMAVDERMERILKI